MPPQPDPRQGDPDEGRRSPLSDPGHNDVRDLLRTIGPLVVGVGAIFTIIGIGSFFAAFGTFQPPRYFWCAFIGLPLVGVGVAICKFAFMGAVSRYIADEVAPVGKDVINYMAEGTQDAVRSVASAVGEGLRGGAPGHEAQGIHCPKCNTANEASASFCKGCGAPLARSKPCPSCGEPNDPDARFCDHCGKALA
jgi:hypothetical protein